MDVKLKALFIGLLTSVILVVLPIPDLWFDRIHVIFSIDLVQGLWKLFRLFGTLGIIVLTILIFQQIVVINQKK